MEQIYLNAYVPNLRWSCAQHSVQAAVRWNGRSGGPVVLLSAGRDQTTNAVGHDGSGNG